MHYNKVNVNWLAMVQYTCLSSNGCFIHGFSDLAKGVDVEWSKIKARLDSVILKCGSWEQSLIKALTSLWLVGTIARRTADQFVAW